MLYEYAILPDVFRAVLLEKRPSACRDLKRLLRGLCEENGILADLHNGYWHAFITEKLLPQLPSTTRSDILAGLNNLKDRNRLVCRPTYGEEPPTAYADWLYAALEAAQRNTLRGIVLSQDLINKYSLPNPLFMEIAEALDSPLWTDRQRTPNVDTSVQGYRAALFPILKYARTIDIIDPYINCEKERFRQFVELCVHLLGSQRATKTTSRISIHAGEPYERNCPESERPYWIEQCLKEWKDFLSVLVKTNSKLRFRVFLWSDRDTSMLFHERYLLTDQCGIFIGLGHDVRAGNITTWSLLDETQRVHQFGRFQLEHSPFKPLAQPLIL